MSGDGKPFVVRFGPWARNLYLGLPAAFAFGLVGVVAQMPWWFATFWFGVIAIMVWICAFPRETRIHAHDRVVVVRRFLALVPIFRRSYPLSAFEAIAGSHAESGISDPSRSLTVNLVLKSGRHLPVQSYSDSAANNQPPAGVLVQTLEELTGLPYSNH